jgi:peptide/nickel transport system ATP-binding protein
MYAGRPVELGSVEDIYYEPRMPYTLGLLGSLPRVDSGGRERLTPIVGSPPSMVNMPPGCPFGPRCPLHIEDCDKAEPPLVHVANGHRAACIRTELVAKAHGDAAEVFDETSTDNLLGAAAYPVDLATSPEGERDAAVPGTPPPDQTEPAAAAPRNPAGPTSSAGDLA